MKYPKRITICGKIYKVRYVKQPMLNDEKSQATINYKTGIIRIRKGWFKDFTTECILHECIHGISDTYDLSLTEDQVKTLSPAIYALFRDNPKLLKLMGNEK